MATTKKATPIVKGDYVRILSGGKKGSVGLVVDKDRTNIPYCVSFPDGNQHWYQATEVEKIRSLKHPLALGFPIKLNKYYSARLDEKGNVRVGCQNIPASVVLKIAEGIKERRRINAAKKAKRQTKK